MPDEACSICIACKAPFTVIRRKHHCRSCGKVWWVMSTWQNLHFHVHVIQLDDSLCLLWHFRFFALAAPPTRLPCPDTDRWSLSGFAHTATCSTSHPSTVTRPASDPQTISEKHTIGATNKSAAVYKAYAALLQHQWCSGHRCTCLARLHLKAIPNGRGRDMRCTARS